ncbi:hypothetical protein LINGRAHAP2_LOCUS27855 [Linum grandiflorum]
MPSTAQPAVSPAKEPDPLSGHRRPHVNSLSSSAKGDHEAEHVKKKVRASDLNMSHGVEEVLIEDVTFTEQFESPAEQQPPLQKPEVELTTIGILRILIPKM